MKRTTLYLLLWTLGNISGFCHAFFDASVLRKGHRFSLALPESPPKEVDWTTLTERLNHCTSGTQARNALQQVAPTLRYYQSVVIPAGAATRDLSDGDLAIQTRTTASRYGILDLIDVSGNREADRFSIGIGATLLVSSALAIAINQSPLLLMGPDILRFLLVWVLVFLPLGLIGFGMRDASVLQSLLVRWQERIDPQLRRRRIQHEAGHFLMGHLLGWPIQGYNMDADSNSMAAVQFYPLADPDVGRDTARQLGFDPLRRRNETVSSTADGHSVARDAVPYFRPERGAASSSVSDDPLSVWPYRGLTEATLDLLAVISVSGMVAEILALGNAYGGRTDLEQLREFIQFAESDNDNAMEKRVRFALGFAMAVLRRHLPQLDALTKVMERGGSVAECIQAIERTSTIAISDYEVQRRQQMRSNRSFLERVKPLLGIAEAPNIDSPMDEDRWVTGKGGGARKQVTRLAGDDPLYFALSAAAVFLAWASVGGISLH
jgi:hypothetical protein